MQSKFPPGNRFDQERETAPSVSAGPKRVWPKVVLLAAGVLAGFLFCEIGARIITKLTSQTLAANQARSHAPDGTEFKLGDVIVPSRNPRLLYELLPNRRGTMWGGIPYRSNSHGMRGPEVSLEKPAGVFRIATLGDSTMFGWAVREEEAYVRLLEQALNSVGGGEKYEVLNFAVPGYNTALESEMFVSRGKAFEPDLVILQFDINDLTLPSFVSEAPDVWTWKKSYFLSIIRGIAGGRGLGEMAAAKIALPKSRKVNAPGVGMVDFAEYRAEFTPPQYRYMVGWDGVLKAVDRLWAAADQLVLHLSAHYAFANSEVIQTGDVDLHARHVREMGPKAGKGKARVCYTDISRSSDLLCKKYGLKPFEDLGVDYPADAHPSPEWHLLIARQVYLGLVENKLLPAGSAHYRESGQIADRLWREADRRWRNRKG